MGIGHPSVPPSHPLSRPLCLTCVRRPTGCPCLSACLPSVKAMGFHALPVAFGGCHASSWQADTGMSVPPVSGQFQPFTTSLTADLISSICHPFSFFFYPIIFTVITSKQFVQQNNLTSAVLSSAFFELSSPYDFFI